MKTLVKEQLTSHTGEEGMILCRKHLKMYSHCKKKEHMNLDFYQPIVIKINVFALNSCELKKKKRLLPVISYQNAWIQVFIHICHFVLAS